MIWFRWPCDRCGKDFRAQVIPFPVGEMGGE